MIPASESPRDRFDPLRPEEFLIAKFLEHIWFRSNQSARLIRSICACPSSAKLTSRELAFDICTHINTATPLRRQVDIVQVSCEEKPTRKV
jgi:hypothetical protein